MTTRLTPRRRLLLLVLALLIGCGIGYVRVTHSPVIVQDMPAPDSAAPLAGLALGGPFTLTDQDGKPVTDKNWPGQYLLVYFGFTHCPDVCPTGLGKIAGALDQLPADQLARIQPIFITIDPARDTPAELKQYMPLFHAKLVGLTGTQSQIDGVIKAYRVYAQKQIIDGDDKNYMMNHSSYTYLVNPAGQVIDVYAHDTTAAAMAQRLAATLRASSAQDKKTP